MTLLICRTCPRYDCPSTGRFGRELAAAVTDAALRLRPQRPVPGRLPRRRRRCRRRTPGLTRVRFTGLTSDDAPAIIKAALAHQASATGDPGDWAVPEELTGRISSITTKRKPVGPSGPPRPATSPPRPGRQNSFPGFTTSYRNGDRDSPLVTVGSGTPCVTARGVRRFRGWGAAGGRGTEGRCVGVSDRSGWCPTAGSRRLPIGRGRTMTG